MNSSLYLKKHTEHRLYRGHLWIYSNEVDNKRSSFKNFHAGEIVDVFSSQEKFISQAYINPNTLIIGRILTRNKEEQIDKDFFISRFSQALQLREGFFSEPFYRLIYSEADRLPGLIVDRYGEVLVVQLNTTGMEALKIPLVEALIEVLKPKTIIFRNDSSSRQHENLPEEVKVVYGMVPKHLSIIENGVKFLVPALNGQKTGWFYDHRDNRRRLNEWIKGKRVLDLFSYMGGWGIQALYHGAKEVVSIESSEAAIQQQIENAKLNQVEKKLVTIVADVFEALKTLKEEKQQFDVVVLDPPALMKRRKDFHAASQAYFYLNKMAMELIRPGGLLVSASCSHHLKTEELFSMIQDIAEKSHRSVRLIAQGHQDLDHPIHLTIPETDYLKSLFIQV